VSEAPSSTPAAPPHLAAALRSRGAMASAAPERASLPRATPTRHDPRPEPGAGVPHAGIWAGGAG
jgi:hypothetical protein